MPLIRLLIVIAAIPLLAMPHAVQGGSSIRTASRNPAGAYSTEVRFNLGSAAIQVDAVLRVAAQEVRSGVTELLLNADLEILELPGPGVGPYAVEPSTFTSDWNLVTVQVTGPPAEGTALPIRLRYRGVPRLPSDGINTIAPEWVELSLDTQWFPVAASLDQEMTGEVLLRLPPSWLVVASGDVRRTGDAHLLRIEVPQVDVAFSAGPQLRLELGECFTVVSRVADLRTSRIVLAAAEDCARYFNSLASDEVRFPGGRIVLAGREGPGYAWKNCIVLSGVDTVHVDRLHAFLCHETSHYWTRSAGARSLDHWMVEAFAEYAASRFLGAHYGPDHF
ncbi:MAG: hypothetical protein KJZ47_04745 [Gemmatimonadales bacterium]|nr:hypothetical protein [Gemmatimonadales bacterium]